MRIGSLMTSISGSAVLVTGGSGLIGSHTVDRLLQEDVDRIVVFDKTINKNNLAGAMLSNRVRTIEGDIANPTVLGKVLEGVDFVFHFASLLLLECQRAPAKCLLQNINGTFFLLDEMIKQKAKRLVYSSSVSVYGSSTDEAVMHEDYPLRNRTMYGASKISGEQFCRVFFEMFGLKYIALRYSSVYGPRQSPEGLYPRLIMHALERIEKGLEPQIRGKGNEVQDFVYIEDVVEANILALKSDVSDLAINIASGVPTTVRELIMTVIELTKPGTRIEFLPASGESIVPYRKFSVKKANDILAWKSKVDLKNGIKKLLESCR